MLFTKFKAFAKEHGLFSPESKVLVTVSGGIDSMVMINLFARMKIGCSIAHCNFQMRGSESDADEVFVREQADIHNIPIFVSRLETEEYASENHLSIQMAARELRYTWFDRLATVHNFDSIAVGHNRDDNFETFFINMGRGTGIAGLSGIAAKSGRIIRPLLFASRDEIEQYALDHNIPHREDSSNASDKYLRNYIRHNIVPHFKKVFPNFNDSFSRTIENVSEANQIYKQTIDQHTKSIVKTVDGLIYIDIIELQQLTSPKTMLFEIIKAYGFSSVMTDEIYQSHQAISGKQFLSPTHKLIKDRTCFIVSPLCEDNNHKIYIDTNCKSVEYPKKMNFEVIERILGEKLENDPVIGQFDYDKLIFPLILRKWQLGDYFVPLGMTGMKKLSDFFIDKKLSLFEKENTWLLTSNSQIIWVVGKRIDNRYKITSNTKNIFKVILGDNP